MKQIMILMLVLAGCSAGENPISQATNALLPGESATGPAQRFAQQLAAGALQLQVGFADNDRSGFVVRDTQRGSVATWLTPEGGALILDQGMLRGTRGLGEDILASEIQAAQTAVLAGTTGQVTKFHTFLNGADQAVTRSYVCDINSRGSRTIQIGSGAAETRLMEEVCSSVNQKFTNLYWVDVSTNQIVQSRQWAGDFTGALLLRIIPQ